MTDSKTDDLQALETEIRRRITGAGPIPVGQYMALCLTDPRHGYYMHRDPLGARGDFITAPEISQMFGELLGLWSMAVWKLMGEPDLVRLIELGPGRGTMMLDILRTAYALPDFRKAVRVHFVEVSPMLEERQRRAVNSSNVPVEWHKTLDEVPYGPSIILANEFFDALPVQQAVMCVDGWHERVIKLDQRDRLQFSNARDPIPLFEQMLPKALRDSEIGEIFEWRADNIALELGRRVARTPGRCARDRLRPYRKRHRRHAAGGRPAHLRQPAGGARRGRPHRARRFPGAGAGRREHGGARLRPTRPGRVPAQSRHREPRRGAAQGSTAIEGPRDRRRARPPHQHEPHRHGAACSR